ncbi:hypothetical protein [Aliivibrio fischeri]|uniref:hypothetical protein n=1 Tax=Aliivibrio fischeri TaxID=668 RepID=UPI00080DE8ED|nr:hypothetical protein [Aliivibrio fischeri]OCH02201.1 hypothetical protein A6E10_17695 [Aliivibrio fischeri]
MKLNKQEEKAIDDMRSILDAITHSEGRGYVCMSSGDLTNIERVLGINLWNSTLSKKQVKKTIRGKERSVMKVCFQAGGQHSAEKHCFFPFQVKEKMSVKV